MTRSPTKKEIDEERIVSVRAGKPVAVFFSERNIPDILLRLNFTGRADDVSIDDEGRIAVTIGPTNIPSKLHPLILQRTLARWEDLSISPAVLETNVDLTQIELRAIDAFQRGTKRIDEMERMIGDVKTESSEDDELALLFGAITPAEWRDSE